MKNFFIFGLPSSGLAWLANFLTWEDSFCFHEATQGVESVEELKHVFTKTEAGMVGTADTTGLLVLSKLRTVFPDAKYLFIVRDPAEVKISLATVGFDESGVDQLGGYLSSAIGDLTLPSAAMRYEDIFSSSMMRQIWDFLEMPGDFPWRRFELLRSMDIEHEVRNNPTTPQATLLLHDSMAKFDRLLVNTFPQPQVTQDRYSGIA